MNTLWSFVVIVAILLGGCATPPQSNEAVKKSTSPSPEDVMQELY